MNCPQCKKPLTLTISNYPYTKYTCDNVFCDVFVIDIEFRLKKPVKINVNLTDVKQ